MKKLITLFATFLVLILIAYVLGKPTAPNSNPTTTSNNPNLLLVGQYGKDQNDIKPLLLLINTDNFTINQIDLTQFKDLGFQGIDEARVFKIGDQYRLALATYEKGKLLIFSASDSSLKNLKLEFVDTFPDLERVRALDVGDINGDGQDEVAVGTRPGGILKYYQYAQGKWTGTVIDKVNASIHDLLITDADRDGKNEIIITPSTAWGSVENKLLVTEPKIVEYKFAENNWVKHVLWEDKASLVETGRYEHARFIFTGNFDGWGFPEMATGIIQRPFLLQLLTLRWNGLGYSQFSQDIGSDVKQNVEIIIHGDIDNDGRDEIFVPTLTSSALLMYKWQSGKWEQQVIADNLEDKQNTGNQIIQAMAIINSQSGGYKKILYITAGETPNESNSANFYVLSYDAQKRIWVRTLVNNLNLPSIQGWGIFPI